MDAFFAELRKIPPVTRFLSGSLLGITGTVLMGVVSPYKVIYFPKAVFSNLEVWRMYTSFFMGSSGINFIFEIAMLYRTANEIEEGPYARKSGDLAWQLFLSAAAIIATSYPVKSMVFFRPFLLCLTYVSSALAPPGAQTSLFGLLTVPVKLWPYTMLALDLLMGGPQAAAQSLPGLIVGHLWWWSIWGDSGARGGPLEAYGRAPRFVAKFFGDTDGEGGQRVANAGGGVQVVRPRTRLDVNNRGGSSSNSSSGTSTGYNWGSGHRLGSN